ncbi:hypothetical protein N7470_008522 [Penicillium chermesinum]|nr:hypothetical protein N7470_008522 [Penicillium chermesinum]
MSDNSVPWISEAAPLLPDNPASPSTQYQSITQNENYETESSAVESGGLDPSAEPALERSRSNVSGKTRNSSALTDRVEQDDGSYAARFIDVSPTRFWMIFSGIMLGYVIGFFDSTLMASSHPVITSYFNAANSASWLSTAFLLTSTAFMPILGRISDAIGRKPVYLFSIFMFFVTTAWCGLAQSIASFIAARALCGLGAGGVFSMGQILSSDLVRLEYRGVYQSYINLCLGTGSCLGLAFGGLLCDKIGWRGAFQVQLPFIFVYFITAVVTVPSSLGKKQLDDGSASGRALFRTIDFSGSILLIASVTLLIMGLNLGGNVFPWAHPLVITSLVASVILAITLVLYERGVPRAVLPVELLSKNPRASIIFGNFFGAVSVNTMMFNAPLYFQAVKLASPTDSGLRLVAASIAVTASSVGTGFLITWSKRMKPTIIVGGLCMLVGGCAAGSMGIDTPSALAMVCVSFSSLGQGFSFPSLMVSILATSEQDDQAVATTTVGLARNLGSVMGVSISSWILQNTLLYELEQQVTGPEKSHIITLVRRSIRAIADLDSVHQHEVVKAYSLSLRITFLSAAVWGLVMLLFHIPLRLPRLDRR